MRKSKEEDKIERLIRALLKLPENRRCLNCNNLGPQYVCTTFWTFVCTSCSGVHREFTHRVKSVSMATFTMDEVNALKAGGNEKARQIYFKSWDPQRNFFPDNSNIHKLREFIKHVYVDRRFTGESHPALIPRSRNSDKDDSYRRGDASGNYTYRERATDRYSRYSSDEIRSLGYPKEMTDRYGRSSNDETRSSGYSRETTDRYGRYSRDETRSPRFRQDNIDRYSRYSNDEPRSPGYLKESSRYGGLRGSPRHEGTDGCYKVDNARIAGRSATQMFTTQDIKIRSRSPEYDRNRDMSSPPPVRNVRELMEENFLTLRVGDRSKSSSKRSIYGAKNSQVDDHSGQNSPRNIGDHSKTAHRRSVSANVQGTARPDSPISAISNDTLKPKSGSVGSLIDFASLPPPPPPPDASSQNEAPQFNPRDDGKNSTSRETSVKEIASSAPPKNTLEFLLFELATPAEIASGDQCGTPINKNVASSPPSSNSSAFNHVQAQSSNGISEPSPLDLALSVPAIGEDRSRDTSALDLTQTPTASASAVGSTADDASTGVVHFGDVNTPNAATSQTMPDLFGDADDFGEAGQQQSISTQHPGTPASISSSTAPWTTHFDGVGNTQAITAYSAASAEAGFSTSTTQISNPAEGSEQEMKNLEHSSSVDTRSSGRTELPADLFTSLYPPRPMPTPGWQMNPSYGMGFNMQYYPNLPTQIAAYPNVAKSANPFDISDDTVQHQSTAFPSVAALQGALPNVSAPSSILCAASLGSHHQGFSSAQSPPYQSGANMGQYSYNSLSPLRQQEVGGFNGSRVTAGSIHSSQQIPYRYPAPGDQRSFPCGGGNPFG